jgi:hypothetical protein
MSFPFLSVELIVFFLEILFGLDEFRVEYDAVINRANKLALGIVMRTHTLSTLESIDDIYGITFGYRFIGTLDHTSVTGGTVFQDM